MKTLYTWNSMIDAFVYARKNGTLVLSPPYQRPFCWTDCQKEKLIDSILNKIPLPAIFVRDWEIESENIEVIDGKQRLTTILEYIDGVFIPKDSPSFKDLERPWKFLKSPLVVYKATDWADEEVKELYNRLNFNGTPHKESERA